jgi:hypothetical protein
MGLCSFNVLMLCCYEVLQLQRSDVMTLTSYSVTAL